LATCVSSTAPIILGGDQDDEEDHGGNLNMQAVLLDTAADAAAAAAAVAFTGAIILATKGNYWLDPAVALVVSAVIAYHAIQLLRRVVVVLRSGPEPVR
jgi:Co/Zn/Cd efflux system component